MRETWKFIVKLLNFIFIISCCLIVMKIYNNELAYEKIEENLTKNNIVNQDEIIEIKIKLKKKSTNEIFALNIKEAEQFDSYINLGFYSNHDNKEITILDEILSQKIPILYIFLLLGQEGLLMIFKIGAI